MLKPQRSIQICIFPKILNIMSFYSKGSYSIGISVIEESAEGNIIRSIKPFITNKYGSRSSSKKATLRKISQTKVHQYMSQQFYVTYNEDRIFFDSMALFKFQINEPQDQNLLGSNMKRKKSSKQTKIYIDLKLYINKIKTIKVKEDPPPQQPNQQNNLITSQDATVSRNSANNIQNSQRNVQERKPVEQIKTVKKVIEVDQRRLYLNKQNIHQVDCYKRILFSDCEHFSILDIYIGSIYLGTKFRLHQYGLTEFIDMEEQNKINHHLDSLKNKQMKCQSVQKIGQLISKSIGIPTNISSMIDFTPRLLEFRNKYHNKLQSSLSSLKMRIKSIQKLCEQLSYDRSINIPELYPTLHSCIELDLHLKNLTNLKQLQNYYYTNNQMELYYEIYLQICDLSRYVVGVWQKFTHAIFYMGVSPFSQCVQKRLLKENVIKKNNAIVYEEIKDDIRKNHHHMFLKRRNQVLNSFEIVEEDDIYHPFIMIEGYTQQIEQEQKGPQISSIDVTSLTIFVHGYQGSDYDLEKAKNYMVLYGPENYGLLIKSIQDQIDEGLQHLGLKVAEQIKNHLRTSSNNYKKINFVGYSLGGVIARQALRHLQQHKSKMNIFISFASPHLGVIKSDNALVGTGIWYLININKVKNLKQLNCQTIEQQNKNQNLSEHERMSAAEQQQKYSSFLQKLSSSKCMEWFQKVVVVSSKQDNFVPYYSSRIDAQPSQYTGDERIIKMSANILKRIKKIERVQVWFDVQHDINTFDKITGRRAHIQFLENRIFLDLFFRMYAHQL